MTPNALATRTLRKHPDLDQLKRQAKELLDAFAAGEPSAAAEVHAHHRGANPATFALHDAQLVLARAYGFQSWPKLKAYVDGVTANAFKGAACAGDLERVRGMLRLRPELVNMNLSGSDDRPLHHAVIERKPEMVRLLLQHGAHAYAGRQPSPLTLATERGYDEIVAIIQEREPHRPEEPSGPQTSESTAVATEIAAALQIGDEDRALGILEGNPALIHAHATA